MDIKLTNVRLSFPQLFKPKAVQPGSEPKYSASFLLSKTDHAQLITEVRQKIGEVATAEWKDKIPKALKIFLHECNEKEFDGYDDAHMYISSNSDIRPSVVDRNMSPLTAEDGKVYAGCRVNVVLRLWAQDNDFGKRVNAQLMGLQFAGDDASFGAAPFDPTAHFTPIGEDAPAGETASTKPWEAPAATPASTPAPKTAPVAKPAPLTVVPAVKYYSTRDGQAAPSGPHSAAEIHAANPDLAGLFVCPENDTSKWLVAAEVLPAPAAATGKPPWMK